MCFLRRRQAARFMQGLLPPEHINHIDFPICIDITIMISAQWSGHAPDRKYPEAPI
jgi:hypothetical protein